MTAEAETLDEAESSLREAGGRLDHVVKALVGNFIFERYNTTFSSLLDAQLSVERADASLDEVRRFIDTEIRLKGADRDLTAVNWKGSEGTAIVDEILQQTIGVFQESG